MKKIKVMRNPVTLLSTILGNHETTPVSEAEGTNEVLVLMMTYDRLTRGTLDDDGYILLNEKMVTAFWLAKQLHENGSPTIRHLTNKFHADFEAAAVAVADIGCRRRDKQRNTYVATGPELRTIYFAVMLYEFFLKAATVGHLRTARRKAAELVTAKLMQVWNQGKKHGSRR